MRICISRFLSNLLCGVAIVLLNLSDDDGLNSVICATKINENCTSTSLGAVARIFYLVALSCVSEPSKVLGVEQIFSFVMKKAQNVDECGFPLADVSENSVCNESKPRAFALHCTVSVD